MVGRGGSGGATTKQKVEEYEVLMPLLQAMFREFTEFAKKKPDGVLSKSRLRVVNRLLSAVYAVLDAEPSREYLDLFEEDELPQNGDVMLMIGQAVAAMKAFHDRYYRWNHGRMQDEWVTGGG